MRQNLNRYQTIQWAIVFFTLPTLLDASILTADEPTPAVMAGYLLVPHSNVDPQFDGGFSMYVNAWPLLDNYPGRRFQTGLFGTWMFAKSDTPRSMKTYSDIEGGLGWWRDTRFATETPKFIMGGVAKSFSEWANGPGAGKGRDWEQPKGKYGVAQLSPYVVWPPDGLNLRQGTCGELFGYGYLPLPLTDAKNETAGQEIPTGDQCWTLFLNTENFRGPVAFFTPYFWNKPALKDPSLAGTFLDAKPANPNKAIQMETQYVPAYQSKDQRGVSYARVAPTFFPADRQGQSPLVHKVTAYRRSALWDSVREWFDGGEESSGRIVTEESAVHTFESRGGSTWRIYSPDTAKEKRSRVAWNEFANPVAIDSLTFGYRWDTRFVRDADSKKGALKMLPEFFRLTQDSDAKRPGQTAQWVAVSPEEVPAETGLKSMSFPRAVRQKTDAYETPDQENSNWRSPGPVAGPFEVLPGDGSVITYYWYRFADQPSLLNADLTDAQREAMQSRVERIHRKWKIDGEYLPPPEKGELAGLDPAIIVKPPPGLEVGYVPIVTRQASAKKP